MGSDRRLTPSPGTKDLHGAIAGLGEVHLTHLANSIVEGIALSDVKAGERVRVQLSPTAEIQFYMRRSDS